MPRKGTNPEKPKHFRESNRPEGAPTRVQLQALVWLNRRNGTGVFGISKKGISSSTNVLLAAGDKGPFMRTTWNELRDLGFVVFEGKRVNVTEKGAKVTFMPPPYPGKSQGGFEQRLPDSRGKKTDAMFDAESVEVVLAGDFEDEDEGIGDELEDT